MGGFHWQGEHLGVELPGDAQALFSTRRGGVSAGPFASLNLGRTTPEGDEDDPAAVAENRRRLAAATGAGADGGLRLAAQVHGADVATDDDRRAEADGQLTCAGGVAATVLVADCLPVAVAAPGAVAMLHAGWRGLAGGILSRGVALLRERAPAGPLHAAVGPGIGLCCFEVGDEVRDAFAGRPGAAGLRRGRHLDLAGLARRELLRAGVDVVERCDLCTACEPALFFSHRRDGARTGRQAGVAWLS